MNYRVLFNLGVSSVAGAALLTLALVSVFSNVEKRKTAYFFLWSLVSALIPVSVIIVLYALKAGNSCPVIVAKILGTFIQVSVFGASYAFMLYCLAYFDISKKTKHIFCIIMGIIGGIYTILMIINAFNGMFFEYQSSDNAASKIRSDLAFVPYTYSLLLFTVEFVALLMSKNLRTGEKVAFCIFIDVPAVALVFHVLFPENSIYTFAIVTAFMAHFLFFYVQRGLMIQKQEKELSEKQIELTISQIRPHFIYNCLSSISYLCTKDPEQAVAAIDDFSSFLRVNFSNISQNRIVPFTQELEHTMKYLKLEKMRFEDRVRVYFDIRTDAFEIPSLTLQPLVENAVKHGICKRAEGGTIIVKTSETDKEYLVEVTDDGVGFNPNVPPADGRVHVGLTNVQKRLKSMVNGRLEIYSKINEGTRMSIHIPK